MQMRIPQFLVDILMGRVWAEFRLPRYAFLVGKHYVSYCYHYS